MRLQSYLNEWGKKIKPPEWEKRVRKLAKELREPYDPKSKAGFTLTSRQGWNYVQVLYSRPLNGKIITLQFEIPYDFEGNLKQGMENLVSTMDKRYPL